jgi:hypothetical protein
MGDEAKEAKEDKPKVGKSKPQFVFRINVRYKDVSYAEGSVVPEGLIEDSYIKQYIKLKAG